jgi:hypothetical protein
MSFKSPDTRVASLAPQTLPLLRPMEVGELLDEAFDLFKKNFRLFAVIAVILTVPLSVLLVATPPASGWRYAAMTVSYVAAMITNGALTYAALERHLGRPTSVAAAYRRGARRFFRLFSSYLVYFVALLLGLLALVVPMFFVMIWGLLLIPVVMVENRCGIGALQRARQLSAGNLWRVFIIALGLGLVFLFWCCVLGALAGVAGALLFSNPSEPMDRSNTTTLVLEAASTVISDLFGAAWSPLIATAPLLAYLDLRIRREAYDLELLTNAVEERVAAARAPVAAPGQSAP